MAQLLVELFSEEIPARMQARAAEDLARLVGEGLRARGLEFAQERAESGPRRLTLVLDGVPEASAATEEEKKGPRVGAPEAAIAGFLKSAGLARIEDAEQRSDAKGAFYVAMKRTPGRPVAEIVAEVMPDAVRRFPWPKAMRWGSGGLRWVRPLHSILCALDGAPVPFALVGVAVGGETRGHRVMGPKAFAPADFDAYVAGLAERRVIVSRAERVSRIASEGERIAAAAGLELVPDAALIEENAGLAEWPVVLLGAFDAGFLDMPAELLMTAMRAHQKCFALRQPNGRLAPRFLMVANLEADDGGAAIVAGNERVIRARLSDAKFFWENDRAKSLAEVAKGLDGVTFHEKLGTQGQRVARIAALAREIAPLVGADADAAEQAARLAKADLVTESVVEFPELQGVMGRHIALAQGVAPEVADAIAEHYKPVGAGDSMPTAPVAVAVALADKLDTLVGFFAIGEAPTGSKDPYALRRAALGVIRIVLGNRKVWI